MANGSPDNYFGTIKVQQKDDPDFSRLPHKLKVKIICYLEDPLPLARCSHDWHDLVYSSDVKSTWLLCQFGQTHALFHAVRIGESFINSEVVELLFEKGAQISRYFAQRMMLGFGKFDKTLIDLKQSQNVVTHYRVGNLWASSLPVNVYTLLLRKAYERFEGNNMPIRGNDMEKFYYLSGGPLGITQASYEIEKNMDEIEMLIRIYKFAPFPSRPGIRLPCEVSDGYTDVLQLNIIARPILICPELVSIWKENGYHEVVTDVNDVVMRSALLILYELEWLLPEVEQVVKKISHLQSYGFKLTDKLIGDALILFEDRLNYTDIGETLIEAFAIVRNKLREDILLICLTELLHPERHIEQDDSLDFVINRMNTPENKILYAFEKYVYSTSNDLCKYMTTKFGTQSRVAKYLYNKQQ